MMERGSAHQVSNAISQYKLKCNQLENEINDLKNAIYQLTLLPNDIHVDMDVDKKRLALLAYLKENSDSRKIKKSVESLVHAMSSSGKKKQEPDMNLGEFINERLSLLVKQLSTPQDILANINSLKTKLKQKVTIDTFPQLLDSLTDLVIQAFQLEHNQLSNFMERFVGYLQEVNAFLELSYQQNLLWEQSTHQLEQELKKNLSDSERKIREYRKNEQNRLHDYSEKILTMQKKIFDIECGAEKMRNHLSTHQINVNQDPLTGLANKTAYNQYILGAFHRWRRGFGDTSIALADLDHFKDVNTKYGHQVGDEILKKVAEIFKSSIRAADFIARYKGESFIFIFERTSAFAGAKVLESLRVAVEDSEIYHNDRHINLTVSFGLTALKHEDTIESAFARVDEAMEQAKRTGRNRLVIL